MPRWNLKHPNRIVAENVSNYGTDDNSSSNRNRRRCPSGMARGSALSAPE